jgi:hypothetical protein
MDSAMSGLIAKLHNGDPVRGWEGDPRLAVYWSPPCWELWRLENDGEYRITWRGKPGTPFDERLIDLLVTWDRRRRAVNLHDEITARNEARSAGIAAERNDYIAEEVAPRFAYAVEHNG